MPYTKQTWVDGDAGGTPISAARLNAIETGIDTAHDTADAAETPAGAQAKVDAHAASADPHTQYALANGSRGSFEALGAVAARAAAAQSANVDTDEATTSTSFVDLATVGPSATVTVPASGRVLILITAQMYNSSGGSLNRVGFAASGANTVAASSNFALASQMDTGGRRLAATYAGMLTGLAAGSTTFTLKYYTNAGTANFAFRRITVIPF